MRPLGRLMKPLSIFKNGSHTFINDPVKCKMFCQRNYKPEKKKKPAIHFGDTKGKKVQLLFKFYYTLQTFFQMAFPPKFSLSQSVLLPFTVGLGSPFHWLGFR